MRRLRKPPLCGGRCIGEVPLCGGRCIGGSCPFVVGIVSVEAVPLHYAQLSVAARTVFLCTNRISGFLNIFMAGFSLTAMENDIVSPLTAIERFYHPRSQARLVSPPHCSNAESCHEILRQQENTVTAMEKPRYCWKCLPCCNEFPTVQPQFRSHPHIPGVPRRQRRIAATSSSRDQPRFPLRPHALGITHRQASKASACNNPSRV